MKQPRTPSQRQSRRQGQRRLSLRKARLRVEQLEDRTVPSSAIIESFDPGNLANYQAAIRNNPGYNLTAQILPIAAHDGSYGLVKQDDYDWLVRNDAGSQVNVGDTVSVWVKLADVADGRAYLGFDAKNTGPTFSRLNQSGAVSVVMAPNTNQFMIETHSGSNGIASFTTVGAAVSQTYQADQWYRLEATWDAGGVITGNLYDSDGVTLLNSVTRTTTVPFPGGAGIAFRAFGHDKYFDTVVLDSGSTDTPDQRVAVDPGLDAGWTPGNPPAPVGNNPTGGPAAAPWAYASTPGTGIEIQLQTFNQLQQATPNGIVNGVVGLAAGNVSLNTGTVQVGWGEPIETPLLAQYMFRQRPGEYTQLVGASSVKHFFSTVSADFQHLNPGESDPYGSSLNTQQSQYTYGSELDPVTGTLHSQVGRGHINNDGMQVLDSRTFTDRIQYLLQVNVADLDPAQNPDGTRWFLAGNLFVDGEQDVAQASRWLEISPHFNGTTFTFTYPGGSTGQLNFRNIPGLIDPTVPFLNNGDFETGDFTGWAQSGNMANTGVDGSNVHGGQYAAFLGTTGSEGFLSQTFSTIAGVGYTLDYWLQHDDSSSNSFHAMIDGVDVPGSVLTDQPAFGYTEYTFTFTANGPTTELKFGFQEDQAYFHLDDVSVTPIPLPAPPPRAGGSGGGALLAAPTVGPASIPTLAKLTFVFQDPAYFHLVDVPVSPILAPPLTSHGDFAGPASIFAPARTTGITIDQLDVVFALAAEKGDDPLAVVSGG
jgi:hypothetical protein